GHLALGDPGSDLHQVARQQAVERGADLASRRLPAEFVLGCVVDPVEVVAFPLDGVVVILQRAEEAGHQVFIGEAVGEGVDPTIDFGLGRGAAEEGLVVATDTVGLAFPAGGKAVGDGFRRYSALQGVDPGLYFRGTGGPAEEVLVHGGDPAAAGTTVVV